MSAIISTITRTYQCMAILADGYPCGKVFDDDTGQAPCPQCGNDDDALINAVEAEEEERPARRPQAKAAHPVKSAALANGKAAARTRPRGPIAWDRLPAWALGTGMLTLWWAFGAKYTIDGLPLLFNLLAGWFHIPTRLPPIADGGWYLRLCWLPILISFVERQYQPWRRRDILSRHAYWLALIWLAVIGVDFVSTYLAIRSPASDAWPLTVSVATSVPLAALWSLGTTFGPESGLSWLWRWLRGA